MNRDRSSSFDGPSAPLHRTAGNYGSSNEIPSERKGDRNGGLSDDGGKNLGQLFVGSVSKQSDFVLASDSSHEPFSPPGIAEASSHMGNLRLVDDLPAAAGCSSSWILWDLSLKVFNFLFKPLCRNYIKCLATKVGDYGSSNVHRLRQLEAKDETDLADHVASLEERGEDLHGQILASLNAFADSMQKTLDSFHEQFTTSLGELKAEIDKVKANAATCKVAISSGAITEASSCMGNLRLAVDLPAAAGCSSDQLQTSSFGSNFEVDFPSLSAPSNTKDKYRSVKGQQSEQAVDALGKSQSKSSQTVDSSIRHGQASHEKTDSSGKLEASQILHPGVDSGIRHGQASHEKADGSGKPENSQIVHPGVPFDICVVRTGIQLKTPSHVRNREKRNEIKRFSEGQSIKVLRPGMVLLSRYLSIGDQVKITHKCRELGLGPGGFYQPGYCRRAKLNLKRMCLGKNWDPQTSMYGAERPIDGAKPPAIPDEFYELVRRAIQDSHAYLKKQSNRTNVEAILPSMTPDICIVNFYTNSGRLGLHQDKSESEESLRSRLPVVSFSIGDSGEFVYGDQRDIDKAEKVILESGDVLIFGGESRHVFHGVTTINAHTAPKVLLEEANLRPGRLNLTFKQY